MIDFLKTFIRDFLLIGSIGGLVVMLFFANPMQLV